MDAIFAGVGFISLVCFLLYVLIPRKHDEQKKERSNTMNVNGVTINLSDQELDELEEKEIQDKLTDFEIRKEYLVNRITEDFNETSDVVRKKVLEQILKLPITDDFQYADVDFLYNDGNLRSNSEVIYRKRYLATQKKRTKYDSEVRMTNILAFTIPFILITFVVGVGCNDLGIVGLIIALIPGLMSGIIGSIIGHTINIDNAKLYCIPDNDPRVIKEKSKRVGDVIVGIGTAASLGKHTKKAVKDITSVDRWQEMK